MDKVEKCKFAIFSYVKDLYLQIQSRRPKSTFAKPKVSACASDISQDDPSQSSVKLQGVDERSWDSEKDNERVKCEINEKDPEGEYKINFNLEGDYLEPLVKDAAVDASSPIEFYTNDCLSPLELPPKQTGRTRRIKKKKSRGRNSNLKFKSVPNFKPPPSPNRGMPGKFMRLSIVKHNDIFPDDLKPKLLSSEEFQCTKAKLAILHKEAEERDKRREERIRRREEQYRREDEEKERLEEIKKEMKKSMMEEKRKQIQARLKEREKIRQAQKIEYKLIQKRSRSVSKKTPMYITMQRQFEEHFERPEIEEKANRLKMIKKERVKPINHSEIKKHNNEYQENLK